uniref:Uncharacterized protein n=1 Tax=Anguilla anguilla TaxID=7936 RepID=A0A0E9TL24_ANGAN
MMMLLSVSQSTSAVTGSS